ncbi:hypothetical protein V491_03316 [Pseudogymnoascus sp. VKM F-3775]|nr:hypothetical protein V491_03316 [Pseudogymnoascus sp. VKM F-3775]
MGSQVPYPQKIPLSKRATANEFSALKQALEDGLDPNVLWDESTLVHPSPKHGCVIPRYVESEESWPHFNTPLHRALRFLDLKSAEFLLQHGADIDLYNSIGRTPLHEAVQNQDHEAVHFLLTHRANINKLTINAQVRFKDQDENIWGHEGYLAIQLALLNADPTTLRLLVEAGADQCHVSQKPWTVLDLALLAGDPRAIEVLLHQDITLLNQPRITGLSLGEIDLAAAARSLLASTKGSDLVPPTELFSAYCSALSQVEVLRMDGPNGSPVGVGVDDLIDGFFKALRKISGEEIKVQDTKMCKSCLAFQSGVTRTFETKVALEFRLHQDRKHLNDSAREGCPLCSITADALDAADRNAQRSGRKTNNQGNFEPGPASPVFLKISLRFSSNNSVQLFGIKAICGESSITLDADVLNEDFTSIAQDHNEKRLGTGSKRALLTAKKWLHLCRDKDNAAHSACQEACRRQEANDGLPVRLLHIAEPKDKPHLVEGKGVTAPYCALSFCWSADDAFATTRANLSQNMDGIPLGSLPQLIQDAISVARDLGYQYLWMDALCIIQDDDQDWCREAARMHTIYSRADLTISSLVASDCHATLFRPWTLRTLYPVPLYIREPKRNRQSHGSLAVFPEWIQEDFSIEGPVHSRAWTLQEQLLSTRTLYFGDGLLYWECLSDYMTEADPAGEIKRQYDYRFQQEKRLNSKCALKGVLPSRLQMSEEHFQPFEHWKQLLEEFTRRRLTYQTDRIPAYLSISTYLASSAGNQFLGGLWKGDRLLESLCWRVTEPLPGPGMSITPSWTWASMQGQISFDIVERRGRGDVRPDASATVVSVDVQVNESQSQVSGSITLKGSLHRKKPFYSSFFENGEDGFVYFGFADCGGVFLDHSVESIEDCYAFDMLNFPQGPLPTGHGYPLWPSGRPPAIVRLLLQPVDNKLSMFRRVGISILNDIFRKDIQFGDEDQDIAPLRWLLEDEESSFNQEITLI